MDKLEAGHEALPTLRLAALELAARGIVSPQRQAESKAKSRGNTPVKSANEYDPTPRPSCGSCDHDWEKMGERAPYSTTEVCRNCYMLRYRLRPGGDWEYRVPMMIGVPPGGRPRFG
jgi:hypothetical protein